MKLVIPSRSNFPEVFKQLGYVKGAEIGVADGDLSAELIRFGGRLYLVDAWKHIGGMDWDVNNPSEEQQEQRYQRVVARFKAYPSVEFRRGWSLEMADTFQDGELDWIYLDADHREESVWNDMMAWFPKVRVGGMLSGHDYFNSPGWETHQGVKAAVDRFFSGKEVGLTSEFKYEHSWYIIKEA